MAKRAAAGAMIRSVWPDEIDVSPGDRILISPRHCSTQKRYPARVFAAGLSIFVALGFISYATYVHQWSELSALRHLGDGPLGK
jgi:hypothetical protein